MTKKRLHSYIHQELEKATVKIITRQGSIGTGFFITPDGYLLTAYHCIVGLLVSGKKRLEVTLNFFNGDELKTTLDLDENKSIQKLDLAVLKVENYKPPKYLPLGVIQKEDIYGYDEILALGYAAGDKKGRGLGFYKGTISRFIEDESQQFETSVAIQGGGQSGGPVYHYETNRVVGLALEKLNPKVMSSAGDALRFDSLFETWHGLKEINDKVAKAWDENLRKYQKPKKQSLHRFYSKLCDRDRQVHDFWNFFQTKCRECANHPQFYFIHGNELEGHGSFIERLINTRIKEYAEKRWGEKYANVSLKKIRWADFGNLDIRRRDLKMNLFHRFIDCYHDIDYSPNALCKLPCLNTNPLVIIKHNIYASKWNKHDKDLIKWYIREYWGELRCRKHIPQFLIFFNIRYRPANDFGWLRIFGWHLYVKRRIIRELNNILTCVDGLCPCGMIEELTPVSIEDVKDWFSVYNIYDNELFRQQKIASIFMEKNKPVKMKSMAEIEIALEQIIKDYEKEFIGW